MTEADLALGRMHIAIHSTRVHDQVHEHRGMPSGLEHLTVGIADRGREKHILHRSSVDEKELPRPVASRCARTGDQSADPDASGLGFGHVEQGITFLRTEKIPHAAREGWRRSRAINRPPVALVMQPDGGKSQRHRLDRAIEMGCFGRIAAQKFAPCRHIVEKRFHLDCGAGCATGIAHGDKFSPFDQCFRPGGSSLGPSPQGELRHAGNAGQRLAAEAHGQHGRQIGGRGDLARGVPLERHESVLAIHARTIIGHSKQTGPRPAHFDLKRARPGIEAVFHQLLDHRGRTLDHFASRDLAGHDLGQHAYFTHGAPLSFDLAAQGDLETLSPHTWPARSTQRPALPHCHD